MSNLTQAQSARIRHVHQQIDNILHGNHLDIIEGVLIDLRHKYFYVKDWELPPALFKSRELFSGGPRLSFPWTELSEIMYGRRIKTCPEPDSEDIAVNNEVIIEAGDKLSIRSIELMRNKGFGKKVFLIQRRSSFFQLVLRKSITIIQVSG